MNMGLRAKSVLALCFCIGVVSLLAWFAGAQALASIEANLGAAFARNATQYSKQRILAPVARELALSQRLADSQVTKRFLLDPKNDAKRELFFDEAEGYRRAFDDHSYFIVARDSGDYYFNDSKTKFSNRARYALKRGVAHDAWFFATMRKTEDFNINVDPDVELKVTKVWFNVLVKDKGENIGLAGTGLDLTEFLNRFITAHEPGVTPMILNGAGAIQAHPNRKLIDYSSVNDKGGAHSTIYNLLPRADDQKLMKDALEKARQDPENIPQFWARLDNKRELFAVSFVPELNWFIVNAVDVSAAQVVDSRLWLPLLGGGVALLLLLVGAIMFWVNRLILAPLFKLTDSARALGAGHYNVELPPASRDEMGDLTRAFGAMAAQVRSHTDELEGKVAQRTHELVEANDQMAHANQQIGDSIQAASLIQNAILPDREMQRNFSEHHFVLWKPRDVVGGDFYVFRAAQNGYLIGVVDCAGHGVPGAFMTMIAYAVLGVAMDTQGLTNPACLLTEMDDKLRAMLSSDPKNDGVATNMDAGLAYVDLERKTVTYAGAKISLYACDGKNVEETKGDRTSIGGKRVPSFSNKIVELNPQTTFYITTDGLLDQAGGPKGYGFGNARFAELLLRQSQRELEQQRAAFDSELLEYQGELPQRDDVTLVSFRFD